MRHDVEDDIVGLVHTIVAEVAEITDRVVDISLAEAVGSIDNDIVASQFGAYEGTIEACRHFERAAWLSAVADEAGDSVDLILDSEADLLEGSAFEEHDTRHSADRSIDDAAQSRQAANAALDIDRGEMAEDESACDFFVVDTLKDTILIGRDGAENALIATSAIAKDRESAAVHTGIGGSHSVSDDSVDKIALCIIQNSLPYTQAIAFETFIGRLDVILGGSVDELEFVDRCGSSILEDEAHREVDRGVGGSLLRIRRAFGALVEER